MQVLLLGSTGRTGAYILSQLLAANHTITALVRKTPTAPAPSGVTYVEGSPMSLSSIEKATTESPKPIDAVFITLASSRETDSPFSKPTSPVDLMAKTAENVLAVMKEHGIQRLVVLSAFGTGASKAQVFWPVRHLLWKSSVGVGMKDHENVEALLRGKGEGVKWTLVKPVMLSDGEMKEVKMLGEDGKGVGMMASCSRRSVAGFMVGLLDGGNGIGEELVRKAVVISE
ncbi:hypothetical protein B0J14DRAFT_702894 [Halenospora varia]|nr:hypothetical protein B0J14DRAFT_702894 [Halenospora varia]